MVSSSIGENGPLPGCRVGDVLVDEADAGHRHRIQSATENMREPRLIRAVAGEVIEQVS